MPDPHRCDRRRPRSRGDREGTCGDPFGLLDHRPATTRRSPENRPHAAPRDGRSWRGRPLRMARTLRRTTPKSPVRVASGRTRLLPADWAPGGRQVPRGTPTAFPRLARESLVLRPEGRVNLTAATAGGATHRPAVRRPDPSALLAGTPTRIPGPTASAPRGEAESRRRSPPRQDDVSAGQTRMSSSER